MTTDFTKIMSERTDKQLVDIVTIKRGEYQPEAVIAAEKEIELRQLNAATFYTNEEIESIKNPILIHNADKTFDLSHKICTILFPAFFISFWAIVIQKLEGFRVFNGLGLPVIVLSYYGINRWLKDNGYETRRKGFLKWSGYTLYIYMALILVVGLSVYFLS
jgi:hypothetical protein